MAGERGREEEEDAEGEGGLKGGMGVRREGEVGCPRRRHVMPSPPGLSASSPARSIPGAAGAAPAGPVSAGPGTLGPLPVCGPGCTVREGASTVLEVASWRGSRIGCKDLEVQSGGAGARGVREVPPGCGAAGCRVHISIFFYILPCSQSRLRPGSSPGGGTGSGGTAPAAAGGSRCPARPSASRYLPGCSVSAEATGFGGLPEPRVTAPGGPGPTGSQ